MTRMLSDIVAQVNGGAHGTGIEFFCPGCKETHVVWVGEGDRPRWGYNNNPEKPTFTPSILVRSGHYCVPPWKPGDSCWCTWAEEEGNEAPFKCVICHSFVTDGVIQFLNDCTHELAGQSVPIPKFEREKGIAVAGDQTRIPETPKAAGAASTLLGSPKKSPYPPRKA